MTRLRVLEVGRGIAAAYCTKLLTDLGAEVTRIEPSSGDALRRQGPAPARGGERGSGLFQYLNSGKQSVALDLMLHSDRDRFIAVAAEHDLVVEDLGPGLFAMLGMVAGTSAAPLSSLPVWKAGGRVSALVSISAFGQSGPYRDWASTSLVLQAAGGWVARIGTPEGPPYYVGGQMEEYVAGAYAAAAALTALRQARIAGQPVSVDLSIFECVLGTIPYPMLQKITFDRLGFPVPQRYQPIPGILGCRDGFVGISALTGQHWADVCAIFEIPSLAEKMREVALRGAEWSEFLARAEPWLAQRTASEVVETFQALRVPAVPIGDGANLPALEPFRSRGFYVEQPESGFLRPAAPFRFDLGAPLRAAPRVNEHAGEVPHLHPSAALADSTAATAAERPVYSSPAPAVAASSWGGGRPGLAFSGLKVLDLTSFWAGPYLTMYLASHGADVVKVESPRRPDGFRFVAAFPQLGERWWEQSSVYQATNLGKRDLALDLDRGEGLALLKRLVAQADVLTENYSPRVLEHFGLNYEALRELNPGLVVVRMPGFGLDGPCRDWVGWALSFEQMCGCATVTGERDGRMFAPGGFADPAVGMHAAVALQAALAHRERRGEGRLIEIAQVEVVAAMTAEQVIRNSITGERMERDGNRSPLCAPQGVYRCAGDDAWVALSVRDDQDWRRLRRVLGNPAWARDAALGSHEARAERHDEIDTHIGEWAAQVPASTAAARLRDGGVPATVVLTTGAMYSDPQLEARGYFHALDHSVCGVLRFPGWPMRFSPSPAAPYSAAAPTLGEHNEEVLAGVLGLSLEEIARLRTQGVIAERMP